MDFKTNSQSGQDKFVFKVLVEPENLLNGTFVDIGACHPMELSNTYSLEKLGWTGYLIERDPVACQMLRRARSAEVLEEDVTKQDWRVFALQDFDYLSLDVDYISHGVLLELLVAGIKFRVATIEHNEYGFPNGKGCPKWAVRALMVAAGYTLVAGDVKNNDCIFEDWFVDAKRVKTDAWASYVSNGRDGRRLMGLIP